MAFALHRVYLLVTIAIMISFKAWWLIIALLVPCSFASGIEVQARIYKVQGCGKSACQYILNFERPFQGVPTVTCTAGTRANSSWGPLTCMLLDVSPQYVKVALDSTNSDQIITSAEAKTISLIAIAAERNQKK